MSKKESKKPKTLKQLRGLYTSYAANMARFPAIYTELAEQLGVSEEAVAKAEIGFIPVDEWDHQAWAFPERTAKGDVIGIQERLDSGKKYAVSGSKRGLAYMVDRDVSQYKEDDGWERTSADYPCPLCGHPDGCMYPEGEYDNPNAVICVKTKTGATKEMGLGHLHVLDPVRQKLRIQNYSALLPSEHPVLIVEGWTDVLAAYDVGFVAVGRPSSSSSKTYPDLVKLLRGRDVVIMGENDAGTGVEGMEATFDRLRIEHRITRLTTLMPPTEFKDIREWVKGGLTETELIAYIDKQCKWSENSSNPLEERLNDVRDNCKEQHKRRAALTSILCEELGKSGKFIKTKDQRAFYFYNADHKLYEIHQDKRPWRILLADLAGLNKGGADYNYIQHGLWNHALTRGEESDIWQFVRHQDDKLYISRFDGTMYVLNGESIQTANNGKDGVLFLDRAEWGPWEIEEQGDFTLQEFVNQINFDVEEVSDDNPTLEEYRQLFTTTLLSTFFIDELPTKPIVLFRGERGSGKTSTIRRTGKLLFGPAFDVKALPNKQDGFQAMISSHFLVGLDNVDTSVHWLNDTLAIISTGGTYSTRLLYTTNEELELTARCFAWLSARTPQFNRDDVSSRLLIFRVLEIDEGMKIPEKRLFNQINEHRNALLGEILPQLNKIVGYLAAHDTGDDTVQFRLADFAVLGKAVWAALGDQEDVEAWKRILVKMEAQQDEFTVEGDTLIDAIQEWMGDAEEAGPLTPAELFKQLKDITAESKMDFEFKNSKSLGIHLRQIRVMLETRCGIEIVESGVKKRTKFRTFRKVAAEEVL